MITTQYTIDKIQYNDNGSHWYGLDVTDFMVPFPYFMKSDVVVALLSGGRDRVLDGFTHYTLTGSQLQLDNQSLGLMKEDGLTASLSITRNTQIDMSVFSPGHPVKAGDLNHNFTQLLYKIEENTSLVMNNTIVSDNQPVNPYKGQHWLRTPYYREYIYTGSEWVQPQ